MVAQEIYYQLTAEEYKVFFARLSLEDKLGCQYEPYIFAALNSAKIMLVIGTQKEYFEAVWVRNEWSRFLHLARKDSSKLLIPCFRDMDAYDLPREISMFQSLDMSKIGFSQDLLRGIKKVLANKQETREKSNNESPKSKKINPLLQRVELFMEDGNWNSAREYCEKILDTDPQCGKAYFCKCMITRQINDVAFLASIEAADINVPPLENDPDFIKANRFADAELTEILNNLQNEIIRQKKERIESELHKAA